MSNRFHLNTGDSCHFPPFFACLQDIYHPEDMVSCQIGSPCFSLFAHGPPLFICVVYCHVACAPLSLLISSYLPLCNNMRIIISTMWNFLVVWTEDWHLPPAFTQIESLATAAADPQHSLKELRLQMMSEVLRALRMQSRSSDRHCRRRFYEPNYRISSHLEKR